MDSWKRLEDKIESAKQKAKKTDAVLEKELLIRCKICGGRFKHKSTDMLICEQCGYEKPTTKSVIRQAIEENPGITAMELSELTGIPRAEIYAYLDDGFLELAQKSVGALKCEICGTKILNGTVCNRCKNVYKDGFGKVNVREGKGAGKAPDINNAPGKSKVHFMGRNR